MFIASQFFSLTYFSNLVSLSADEELWGQKEHFCFFYFEDCNIDIDMIYS